MQSAEELESLRCERDRHQSELSATSEECQQIQETICSNSAEQAENVRNLQTELRAVTEERDQLKRDMEENVELVRS